MFTFDCVSSRKKSIQVSFRLIAVMGCNLATRTTLVTSCMQETLCRFILCMLHLHFFLE